MFNHSLDSHRPMRLNGSTVMNKAVNLFFVHGFQKILQAFLFVCDLCNSSFVLLRMRAVWVKCVNYQKQLLIFSFIPPIHGLDEHNAAALSILMDWFLFKLVLKSPHAFRFNAKMSNYIENNLSLPAIDIKGNIYGNIWS